MSTYSQKKYMYYHFQVKVFELYLIYPLKNTFAIFAFKQLKNEFCSILKQKKLQP